MGMTAESLVNACFLDDIREVSPGAFCDFGMDIDPSLFQDYQRVVRDGVGVEQLHRLAGDGKGLSILLGKSVTTMWDVFELPV